MTESNPAGGQYFWEFFWKRLVQNRGLAAAAKPTKASNSNRHSFMINTHNSLFGTVC